MSANDSTWNFFLTTIETIIILIFHWINSSLLNNLIFFLSKYFLDINKFCYCVEDERSSY